jgi:hypothetical protein
VLKGGKAAVAVTTQHFEPFLLDIAARAGRPGVRHVALPYPIINHTDEQLAQIARAFFPPLLAAIRE